MYQKKRENEFIPVPLVLSWEHKSLTIQKGIGLAYIYKLVSYLRLLYDAMKTDLVEGTRTQSTQIWDKNDTIWAQKIQNKYWEGDDKPELRCKKKK